MSMAMLGIHIAKNVVALHVLNEADWVDFM
jgi:hypothetical protein